MPVVETMRNCRGDIIKYITYIIIPGHGIYIYIYSNCNKNKYLYWIYGQKKRGGGGGEEKARLYSCRPLQVRGPFTIYTPIIILKN